MHPPSHAHPHRDTAGSLVLYSPSGVLTRAAPLRLAARRLAAHGFAVELDTAVLAKRQRFAGDDAVRLDAIHRVARRAPDVALASRGGYGLSRLLDRIDWKLIQRSIERGTRWVGHSDFTALQLALLAHAPAITWAGPMACDDFGRAEAVATGAPQQASAAETRSAAVDDVTESCFLEAMSGALEAVGFRTDAGFDGLAVRGTLWGGNLCIVNSLLGTPHWPAVKGGVLFLEDVNEHPYRVERSLIQLAQAGVLQSQKAVVLGAFSGWRKSVNDRGYGLKAAVDHVRTLTKTPVLTGLPFGHVPTKLCLPVGARVQLLVEGRDAFVGWA